MAVHYNTGLKMSRLQILLGWLYLPCYLVFTSLGIRTLAGLLGITLTTFQLNVLYFSVNLLFVLLVFSRFLRKSLRGFTEHFWQFVQTVILGFAMYYLSRMVLAWVLSALPWQAVNENHQVVSGMISHNRWLMLVFTVAAAPVVEEVLIRGVVFGSLHRTSRVMAYAASILIFCVMHVWQFYTAAGMTATLLGAVAYLPAAAALGWTYEKSGTIWTPIVLHVIINAIAYGAAAGF